MIIKKIDKIGNIRLTNNLTNEYVDLLFLKNKNLYNIITSGRTLGSTEPINKSIRIAKDYLNRNQYSKPSVEAHFKKVFKPSNITRLSDNPSIWRHCCNRLGVGILTPECISLNGSDIYYIHCLYCNSVIYYVKE